MHESVFIAALLFFTGMCLPLPSPLGIAMALWALRMGVPLPALLGLYVAQDMLSFTAIGRLMPQLRRRFGARVNWSRFVPVRIRRPLVLHVRPATSQSGLFAVALASFYAAAALATLRDAAPFRSAAIVITTDVVKYANGIAVALGATVLLPSSPYTIAIASFTGLAVVPGMRLMQSLRRPALAVARVSYR